MTSLPTYHQLLVELHATLECVVTYSRSKDVVDLAQKRLAEINTIQFKQDHFYIVPHILNNEKK